MVNSKDHALDGWQREFPVGLAEDESGLSHQAGFQCLHNPAGELPCIFWSILWSRGSALRRGFLAII